MAPNETATATAVPGVADEPDSFDVESPSPRVIMKQRALTHPGFLISGSVVLITFIPYLLLVGLFTLSLIQHRWPPRALLTCPGCAYDLGGLTRNVCPECGDAFTARCGACGCELSEMATGTCPECDSRFAPETVVIRPVRRAQQG